MELDSAIKNKQWKEARDILGHDRESLQQRLTEPENWYFHDKLLNLLSCAIIYCAPADIITQLISPHINIKDKDGETALHVAMRLGKSELVPVLLQQGADVNLVDHEDRTSLHMAALYRVPVDIITQLISPININMQDKDGETALHVAVRKQRWELVPVLLRHGADVNLVDDINRIPLRSVQLYDPPTDIITQLISPHNINMQGENFATALQEAVRKNRWELVPVLLQQGADVNLFGLRDGTPLHTATLSGAPTEIITQLISPSNINMQDRVGETTLHVAVRKHRWELVPVLLRHGADINLVDHRNRTPLCRAAWYGAPSHIITQLISPSNINRQDTVCDTALHLAVLGKRWDLVPVLLQYRADINLGDGTNQTPLHSAAFYGAPADIITQLISPQNINKQDKNGKTALNEAVIGKSWDQVPVLIQHGADPYMLDSLQVVQPLVLSLKALCIVTIRSHMPDKSDAAYKGLGLPRILESEVKLKPQAEDIVKRGCCE